MNTQGFNGLDRIQVLGFEIIKLLAQGKQEDISVIESKAAQKALVNYLVAEYKLDLYDGYDVAAWEDEFCKCSEVMTGSHSICEEYNLPVDGNGLVLVLGLVLKFVSENVKK